MLAARLRLFALGSVLLLLLGCGNSEPITRPPDPPLDAWDWFVIWTAVVLVFTGWAAVYTARLLRGRQPSVPRLVAGSLFSVGAAFALLPTADAALRVGRLVSMVGWDECREVAVEDRPRQIVQVSCIPGNSLDLTLFSYGYLSLMFTLLAVICALCAADLLRYDSRPWLPSGLAWIATVGIGALAISGIDNNTSGPEWLALGAALLGAAVAAICASAAVRG